MSYRLVIFSLLLIGSAFVERVVWAEGEMNPGESPFAPADPVEQLDSEVTLDPEQDVLSDVDHERQQDTFSRPEGSKRSVILEENFDDRYLPVHGALGQRMGSLPSGWSDESGPGSRVSYGPIYEGQFEGLSCLRMIVEAVGRSRAVLQMTPVHLRKGQLVRLSLALRSVGNGALFIGLRSGSEAGRIYFEQPINAGDEWNAGDVVFQSTVSDPEAQFYVAFEKPGAVDLDALKMSPVRPRDATGIVHFAESVNLLPSSSFPIGVTAPWIVLDAESCQTDRSEIGPTGQPALKMVGLGASLSVPYSSQGRGKYTYSLYLKGSRNGQRMSVILMAPSGSPLLYPNNQTLTLSTNWRRYTSTVPFNVDPDGHFLARLVSKSESPVWVDGCQVERGGRRQPFHTIGTG